MRSTRLLRRELKQRRMALLKGGEVVRFVVRTALDPAAEQDANPLEGQGSERGVAGGALGTMLLVELPRPEGLRDALGRPFDKGLTEESGRSKTPVDPALLAAALGHGRDPRVTLERGSIGKALARLPEGSEQARREDRSCARQGPKELVVAELVTQNPDLVVKVRDDNSISPQTTTPSPPPWRRGRSA